VSRYLLDTNTVSHLIKGNPAVVDRVTHTAMANLCISAITEGELLFGLANRPNATRLHHAVRELLRRINSIPWDHETADRYGTMRAALTRQSKPLAPMDTLIAAHALHLGTILVTNDKAFAQVPNLTTEDWCNSRPHAPNDR
jgi:tRNA(fMet)-specific endonuclease VapC